MVDSINHEYSTYHNLSNDKLRSKLNNIKEDINKEKDKSQAIEDYLVPVFAIIKETARRFSAGNVIVTANSYDKKLSTIFDFVEIAGDKAIYKNHWDVMGMPFVWDMIHYDEQILGGILLHYGFAIEMATGEGKTLTATLPVFLNALTHAGVHLMTVNEYLSQRDFELTRPIYMFYGLTVDCLETAPRNSKQYKAAYKSDIIFGSNSSFTFDYLFDHITTNPDDCVQNRYSYAIIDELDSILIDEADCPHIVSMGNTYNNNENIFQDNFHIVKELVEHHNEGLFEYDKLKKSAWFTDKGKNWLSFKKDMPDLYAVERTYELYDFEELDIEQKNKIQKKLFLQRVFNQILLALTVYERDVDYIVEDNRVKIISPKTGRVMETHRWQHGLHTAIEVKENVRVQNDFDGLAVISLKNYFRLYRKIAGMSGTIMPVKDELKEVYNLQCAPVPTHKPLIRRDFPLRVFKTIKAKDAAIIETIIQNQRNERPTLIGSITIKRSEEICSRLDALEIKYNKLDARNLTDEALIISKAGTDATITASTAVAGRGTDIKLSTKTINAGGLMVIGTDLFESIRIDRQLKGRAGRQGDPGSSIFFASLEDSILKYLDDIDLEKLNEIATKIPNEEISCPDVRIYFEEAQTNCEAYSKTNRNEIARKDDIIEPWRKKFYDHRNAILFNSKIVQNIVGDIITTSKSSASDIAEHLASLYLKTKELVVRSTRNNSNRTTIPIPFADNLHTFVIRLKIELAITSFEYFCNEYKRQIVLQVYDKEWKKFILYVMSDLDNKEIEMLDIKYQKMITKANTTILSRLQFATIQFDSRNNFRQERVKTKLTSTNYRPMHIRPDSLCPCGSSKMYCECHGNNNRSTNRQKRRR